MNQASLATAPYRRQTDLAPAYTDLFHKFNNVPKVPHPSPILRNQLVKITDSMGGVIERTYDDRDNLISLKDPKGHVTRYDYDRNNRLLRVIRPMGQETRYADDAAGNRSAVYDVSVMRDVA